MGRDQQTRGRGRFQGRGGGRGGGRRYQGPRGGSARSSSTTTQPKVIMFAPQSQGKPQTATFGTVKDAVLQHILKTFKDGQDVTKSIETGVVVDLLTQAPNRQISANADPDKAKIEQDGYNILYEAQIKRFFDREDSLRQGMVRAYAIIFSNYCTKAVRKFTIAKSGKSS